eukprot:4811774-Alexandrium_andersonii.AAC.1
MKTRIRCSTPTLRSGCSSNSGISEPLVQSSAEFRSWPLKQFRESASSAPAGPLRPSPGSFGER